LTSEIAERPWETPHQCLVVFFAWLGYPIVLFAIEFLIIQESTGADQRRAVFAIVMFVPGGDLYLTA
jgi:hypothetical protein